MGDVERSSRWSLAATLGLIAVALLVERLAPARGDGTRPSNKRSRRDAPAVGLAAEREDRGRCATTPSEIPARGWKDIFLRVYANISDHRVLALAAGMTYYSLLAIFPALAALVAIYGLFSDPGTIANHLDKVSGFIPGGAIDVAREQLTRVSTKGSQTLGLTFAIGVGVSLWSANAAMKSLFDTLNIVYGEKETRGFLKLNVVSLTFTVAGILFIVAALGAVVVVPVVLNFIGMSDFADLLVRIARWPVMFVVVALALALIYRFGPDREAPRWRWITWGSAVATILWLTASTLSHGTPQVLASSMKPTARWGP